MQNAGREGNRVFRRNHTVGFNDQSQFVIVGNLSDTGTVNTVGNAFDRRINRINGNQPDRRIGRFVLAGRNITFSGINRQFHVDFGAGVQRADKEIGVFDFNVMAGFNHRRRHFARTFRLQIHGLLAFAVNGDGQSLDVQDNIGNVFSYTRDNRKFM